MLYRILIVCGAATWSHVTSQTVPNIFMYPPPVIFGCGCEKQICCCSLRVGSSVICLLHARENLRGSSHFSFGLCVCLQALMSCCVFVNHTHPVCRATRLGTDALCLTPHLFLSRALALSVSTEKTFFATRWKSHKSSTTPCAPEPSLYS